MTAAVTAEFESVSKALLSIGINKISSSIPEKTLFQRIPSIISEVCLVHSIPLEARIVSALYISHSFAGIVLTGRTMRSPILLLLPLFAFFSYASAAANTLYAEEASYCSNSRAIIVDAFNLTYYKANNSLAFEFALRPSQADLNVEVNLYVAAYGIQIANETVNLCDFLSGVLCPLPQINFTGESFLYMCRLS